MTKQKKNLVDLKNVGKVVLEKLHFLKITRFEQLVECDPTELFLELEEKMGVHVDFCVWDVFAAIIHEAQTGKPVVWHTYTPERKKLFNKNRPLCEHRK